MKGRCSVWEACCTLLDSSCAAFSAKSFAPFLIGIALTQVPTGVYCLIAFHCLITLHCLSLPHCPSASLSHFACSHTVCSMTCCLSHSLSMSYSLRCTTGSLLTSRTGNEDCARPDCTNRPVRPAILLRESARCRWLHHWCLRIRTPHGCTPRCRMRALVSE